MVPQDARLLVVDDDPAIREFLKNRLTMEGYEVFDAEDAERALEILKELRDFDLILLDVIMPGATGFDLLRIVKKDSMFSHIPVIMVTALGLVQDKELAFRLGAGDYLTKPFDTREMLARIETHITLKKKSDAITQTNQLLSTILATIPGMVYMKDKERRFLHVNHLFELMCGISAEQIIGNTEQNLANKELTEAFRRSEDLIFSHGIPFLENLEDITTPSGENRKVFFRRQPVSSSEGTINGLVGVGIDLTEQVILRNILSDREAFLSTLMDSFPARIWAIDKNYLFTQQNSCHAARWGSLIGKSIDEVETDIEIRGEWRKRCSSALSGNKECTVYPRGTGETCRVLMSWTVPIIENDILAGVLGISFDIDENTINDIIQTKTNCQGDEPAYL
ncbi:response regulator [Methanospirillum sp.]|jgi:PAS domain S-box-containing protein|uniref:response regulator n=1 Tax=Methanospirillum sp. TaxID=45200 RepID=UPI001BD2FDFD|nr:response regulator [Methanospirillum sp.]